MGRCHTIDQSRIFIVLADGEADSRAIDPGLHLCPSWLMPIDVQSCSSNVFELLPILEWPVPRLCCVSTTMNGHASWAGKPGQ
jgi:hypothetical protein